MISTQDLARLTGTSVEQAEARTTRSRRHYEEVYVGKKYRRTVWRRAL